jgi:hypothetical protein
MAIVGRVVDTAAGAAEVLTTTAMGARPATRGRTSPTTKSALMVAVALLALAALLSASEAPNAEHYYYYSAGTTPDRSGAGAAAPVFEPAALRMSERGPRRLRDAPAFLRSQRKPD